MKRNALGKTPSRLGKCKGTRLDGVALDSQKMRSMRVLHLIDTLGVGGTEHQLALNVSALDPHRIQSVVCYLRPPHELRPLFEANDVPIRMLGVNSRLEWGTGVARLRKLVKELEIDLIHTQLFHSDIVGGVTGRLMGIPVVSTLANSLYEREWLIDNPHQNSFKLQVSLWTRKLVARRLDAHLIAVSGSVKSSAIKQLGVLESKVSVVYRSMSPYWFEGVEQDAIQERKRQLGIEDCYPIIVNTGRLIPQKGQRYLVEAMPAILERFPRALSLIVGEGFLRESLESLTHRLGLQNHVRFLGRRRDVQDLLQVGDIFAFPSLHEGCPNALLEAMAVGVPAVASNIGPNYEVSMNGDLVALMEPFSSQALAEAVIEVLSQPESAREVSQRAREVVRRKFTLAAASERITEVFESYSSASATRAKMLSSHR